MVWSSYEQQTAEIQCRDFAKPNTSPRNGAVSITENPSFNTEVRKCSFSSTPESLPDALQCAREVINVFSTQTESTTLLRTNYTRLVLAGRCVWVSTLISAHGGAVCAISINLYGAFPIRGIFSFHRLKPCSPWWELSILFPSQQDQVLGGEDAIKITKS